MTEENHRAMRIRLKSFSWSATPDVFFICQTYVKRMSNVCLSCFKRMSFIRQMYFFYTSNVRQNSWWKNRQREPGEFAWLIFSRELRQMSFFYHSLVILLSFFCASKFVVEEGPGEGSCGLFSGGKIHQTVVISHALIWG